MEKKKYRQSFWDVLTDMFIVAVGSCFLSLALAYVMRVTLAYFILPGIGYIVPSISDFFKNQTPHERESFGVIAYDICLAVSFFVSMFIVTPLARNRKTVFIKVEKGEFVSPIKGICHFLVYNWGSMLLNIYIIIVLNFSFSINYGMAPFYFIVRYFNTEESININSININSILYIAIFAFSAEMLCILHAQKRWLIDYYIGEE